MPVKATQRQRKARGAYCETLTQQVLKAEDFEIREKFEGGESRAKKASVGSCPDLVVGRPGQKQEYRIEVKSGQVFEKDDSTSNPPDGLLGIRPDRPGRVQLSAGKTKRVGIAAKDCYALSLDDAVAKVRTIEFFDPTYMDMWLKRDIDRRRSGDVKGDNSSKFPLKFLRQMREDHPCPINELKGKVWVFDQNGKLLKDCDIDE